MEVLDVFWFCSHQMQPKPLYVVPQDHICDVSWSLVHYKFELWLIGGIDVILVLCVVKQPCLDPSWWALMAL